MGFGNKQGCRAAVQVHLSGMAVNTAGWGKGTPAGLDWMQLKSESDWLKRQKHIVGLLSLKHFSALNFFIKEQHIFDTVEKHLHHLFKFVLHVLQHLVM